MCCSSTDHFLIVFLNSCLQQNIPISKVVLETYFKYFLSKKYTDRVNIMNPKYYITTHSMMRWNLTSKKLSTPTEYGVWKLILCSFTYQSQKNPIPWPRRENSQNLAFESEITERTKFFQ